LGAYYARRVAKCGSVCIFLHKSCKFVKIDLNSHCIERDFEICAIKLTNITMNLYILSLYKSPSGNFDMFLAKLEEVLNALFIEPINLIIYGDFNVNFMIDTSKKGQLTSLLKTYNLEYIVNFPTRTVESSETIIDNIFLDTSKYSNFVIEPGINGLSDHDALILTLNVNQHVSCKSTKFVRRYNDFSIKEFQVNLSYENWSSVFHPTCNSDIDEIFNNF